MDERQQQQQQQVGKRPVMSTNIVECCIAQQPISQQLQTAAYTLLDAMLHSCSLTAAAFKQCKQRSLK
jgi:hypothetical protein